MQRCRLTVSLIGWVLIMTLSGQVLAQNALQPEELPDRIINTRSALTPNDGEEIDTFIAQWLEILIDGSDQDITNARSQLLEPISASTSQVFLGRYAAGVRSQFGQALSSDNSLATRLNAMIIIHELADRGLTQLILRGLSDPSPAVQYWAALSIQELAETDVSDDLDTILRSLDSLMNKADSKHVLEAAMVATVVLDESEATELYLRTLENRLPIHFVDETLDYSAELKPLPILWQRLLTRSDDQQDEIKRLAKIAGQYFNLAAGQLEAGLPESTDESSHIQMLRTSETILRGASGIFNASRMPDGNQVSNAIRSERWTQVIIFGERWLDVLKAEPFSFTEDELIITRVR